MRAAALRRAALARCIPWSCAYGASCTCAALPLQLNVALTGIGGSE
jgi:hypothetical protein